MNINDRIHLISKGLTTWTTIFSLDHIFSAGSSSSTVLVINRVKRKPRTLREVPNRYFILLGKGLDCSGGFRERYVA